MVFTIQTCSKSELGIFILDEKLLDLAYEESTARTFEKNSWL
jgi:hypothetical protein